LWLQDAKRWRIKSHNVELCDLLGIFGVLRWQFDAWHWEWWAGTLNFLDQHRKKWGVLRIFGFEDSWVTDIKRDLISIRPTFCDVDLEIKSAAHHSQCQAIKLPSQNSKYPPTDRTAQRCGFLSSISSHLGATTAFLHLQNPKILFLINHVCIAFRHARTNTPTRAPTNRVQRRLANLPLIDSSYCHL